MSSSFANYGEKIPPGNLKQTLMHSLPHLVSYVRNFVRALKNLATIFSAYSTASVTSWACGTADPQTQLRTFLFYSVCQKSKLLHFVHIFAKYSSIFTIFTSVKEFATQGHAHHTYYVATLPCKI